jgi:hypothetical protein
MHPTQIRITRTRAALIHLAISSSFAIITIALILFGWYTLPYFWLIGGPLLLALIVAVDVVLGPLMTFIVCSPSKPRKELLLDLSLIGLVQIAALAYGLHASYTSRLVYAVYTEGSFHLVKATELGVTGIPASKRPEFSSLPLFGPRFIGAQLPTSGQSASDLSFFRALGVGDFRVPAYYAPLAEFKQQMADKRLSRDVLTKRNPALLSSVDALLSQSRLKWDEAGVFPIDVLQRGIYTVVLDLNRAAVLKVLPQAPVP